jgi:catechol 2,3-dioxygenase-like lactoylglutathione lyase family enzyme
MNKRALSRIILFVADPVKMTSFYRDVIGLPVIEGEGSGFVILDAGGCQLCLHQIPPQYIGDAQADAGPREDSYVKFVFHAVDIEAEREALVKSGVKMKSIVRFEGIAICDGSDPEGNIFQISSRT